MSEWKEYKFSDFADINPKVATQSGVEYSFIEMPDLEAGYKFVGPSRKREAKGLTKFQNGDTLFAKITPCLENGKISQARNLENNIGVGSTEFIVFRGKENVSDSEFIYYLLRFNDVKNYAVKNMSGSAGQQRVPLEAFDNLEIPLPELPEQQSIAAILSSLDNKIDLLRRQNQTLEQLAQTIFKQWFVQFQYPGANGKMQPTELGEVPEDWRVSKIGDEAETLGGGTPSTDAKEYWQDGNINWYSPTDLTKADTLFSLGSGTKINEEGLKNSSAKLFPAYSLMLTSRATVGVIAINTIEACTNQGFITIIPNENVHIWFLLGWLKLQIKQIHMLASGSTFPEISKSDFRSLTIIMPAKEIMDSYEKVAEPIYKSIENNQKEIQTLTQLRDSLLPRFMSGRLRVG